MHRKWISLPHRLFDWEFFVDRLPLISLEYVHIFLFPNELNQALIISYCLHCFIQKVVIYSIKWLGKIKGDEFAYFRFVVDFKNFSLI